MREQFRLRVVTTPNGTLLLRISQRFFEVLFRDLQVVLFSDRLRVSDPCADHMRGELIFQFRLPTAAHIVEDLRPGCESRATDDAG
ncbi:hypothetical protein CA54_53420 [Symmachiella macrocystis]|uniref:Uncharacterized protein n=1 Tax=Symmachiella macrocystis TaxID=2527985 RepID=A0A5C6B4T1_9PLAN|nr:hypothetical protein CA54_53420 [Symmachiella macrocystis]